MSNKNNLRVVFSWSLLYKPWNMTSRSGISEHIKNNSCLIRLCALLTSTRWIETKINHRTQHFFCVFHKKWTTSLKLKSQKFDEQSWCPPKLIELCMVAMLWRHGLIKFDNCSGLAMFWTFRSHVRLNIVTVNLLESFSLHWSFYIWDRMAKNGPSKNQPERSDLP